MGKCFSVEEKKSDNGVKAYSVFNSQSYFVKHPQEQNYYKDE